MNTEKIEKSGLIAHLIDEDPIALKPALAVSIDVQVEAHLGGLERMWFSRRTRRQTDMALWDFTYNEKSKVLTFMAGCQAHASFRAIYGAAILKAPVANTFADFCWLVSDGTTSRTVQEVRTKAREGVPLGDLSWVLPMKFSEDLLECLYSANEALFEGILQDAILVGPIYPALVPGDAKTPSPETEELSK